MKTSFIEDYLQDPSAAIASAVAILSKISFAQIEDEQIYSQISSPEFRLYEEMVDVKSYLV